jgi:hypothetical protein
LPQGTSLRELKVRFRACSAAEEVVNPGIVIPWISRGKSMEVTSMGFVLKSAFGSPFLLKII